MSRAAQRVGLQLQQTALTVNAMPQKSRRQNATEFRNAQLSVVRCNASSGGSRSLRRPLSANSGNDILRFSGRHLVGIFKNCVDDACDGCRGVDYDCVPWNVFFCRML